MRRSTPVVLVVLGLLALLGSYVWYTKRVVTELERESRQTAQIISRTYAAVAAPTPGAYDQALLDVITTLQEFGIPMIVTDSSGRPTEIANLPFEHSGVTDPKVIGYVDELDKTNPQVHVGAPGFQVVHFGSTPLVEGLRVIPLLQVTLLGILIVVGALVLHTRNRVERERVWAGMAREAAHQLGTPLSSLHGWTELLRESSGEDPAVGAALPHITSDIERLERVAHRFERIGRPARREPVDVGEVAAQVAGYYRARLPTLANAITIDVHQPASPLVVHGDRVLLEWVFESLVKNAVDALSGQGGSITLTVSARAENGAVVRVADSGPGIPRELQSKIFNAGFSTKEGGWGIGLPLARRIVEEGHRGRLVLASSDRGAVFDVILPG